MKGRLRYSSQLRLALLLLEIAALTCLFLGADPSGFRLLLGLDFLEPPLLLFARATLGFGLLLHLTMLRVLQYLLDGDHHRSLLLPIRHDVLFL